MEGIPRVPMFSLELLTPDNPLSPHFEQCIREYIVITYQDDPSKYNTAFRELESMRKVAMQNSANVEEICILKRYFAQLTLLKSRFPMEEGDPLATPFSWIDRGYDLSTAVTYNDINFELCCVLFNIGAAHAFIAANETRSDADSVKNAFMHFQYASWPMQHLRDEMRACNYGGMSFSNLYLTFYADMFLAQAQECILEKSIADGRKAQVIAKVAAQLKKYYESNLSILSLLHTELTSIGRYKALFRLCATKMELYDALAAYYLGVQAEADNDMSLRVSYFTYALERIAVAVTTSSKDDQDSLRQAVQFAHEVIEKREENARKENDFIYHARLIKPQDFDAVEGVVMVKPIPFDPNDASVCGEDLFAALLPTDVLKTVSLYSEEKTKFRRAIVEKAQEKDAELETYLLSLQLIQLHLDEPIESVRLPDELLSASAAFTAQPNAFPALIDKFDGITRMASDAERRLADLGERIDAVAVGSAELADDDGFRAIRAKVDELNSHHVKARQNNVELQRAIAAHSENLKLLAMPLTHITKEICGDYINPMEHAEGQQLRRVLDKVDEMRRQRCTLLQTLAEDLDVDDITKRALADRDFHPQELFEKALKKHEKLTNVIQQNLIAQNNILGALTEANANFAEFRRRIVEGNEKRALHSLTLVTAHNVFLDVSEKTDKAITFYKQLFRMIDALTKGVAIIEETEEKKRQKAERLLAEKRAAKECAEALQDFGFGQAPLPKSRDAATTANGIKDRPLAAFSPGVPTATNMPVGGGSRPRLGDYMDYYRSKMVGGGPPLRNNIGGVSTPENAFRPIFVGPTAAYAPSGPCEAAVQPISAPVACAAVPGNYSVAPPPTGIQSQPPAVASQMSVAASARNNFVQPQPVIPSTGLSTDHSPAINGQPHQFGHPSPDMGYALSPIYTSFVQSQASATISQSFVPTSTPTSSSIGTIVRPALQCGQNSAVYGHGVGQYNGTGQPWPSQQPPNTGHTPAMAQFLPHSSPMVLLSHSQQYIPSAPMPVALQQPPIAAQQPQISVVQQSQTLQNFAGGQSQPQPSQLQQQQTMAITSFGPYFGGLQQTQPQLSSPLTPSAHSQPQLQSSGAPPHPTQSPACQPMHFHGTPTAGATSSPWHQNMSVTNPYAAYPPNQQNRFL